MSVNINKTPSRDNILKARKDKM